MKMMKLPMLRLFTVLLMMTGCADLKEIHDMLGEPPATVVFPKGDQTTSSNIDDVFARLDGWFHFEDPNDVGDTPAHQWVKQAGAKYKVIPGVSYEIFAPYTVENGEILTSYGRYNKNGKLWVWLSLKKSGSGTIVKYAFSGKSKLHHASEVMEQWILKSV